MAVAQICFDSTTPLGQWFREFDAFHKHMPNISNLTKPKLKGFAGQTIKGVLGNFDDPGTNNRREQIRQYFQTATPPRLVPDRLLAKENEGQTFMWFMSELLMAPDWLVYRLFHCVGREFNHVQTTWLDPNFPAADMAESFGLANPNSTSPALGMLDTLLKQTVKPDFYVDASVLKPGAAGVTVFEVVERILR